MTANLTDKTQQHALARLEKLRDILLSSTVSPRTLDNLCHDLDILTMRLESGAYEETDFAARSLFDIPRRTREFFHYLAGYYAQAKSWAVLLGSLPLETYSRIIDVCPGWAPKIEWALILKNYSGEVIVYDKEKEPLDVMSQFLEMLQPHYSLQRLQRGLSAPHKPVAPLVVANHIIDDLLLHDAAQRSHVNPTSIYESESTFVDLVQRILKDADHYQKMSNLWVGYLSEFVAENGTLILTHYSSLTESFLRLTDWTDFCSGILSKMMDKFLEMGFSDITAATTRQLQDLSNPYFHAKHVVALTRK